MVAARGMTLIEVMVALLVSVVGLVGALAMMRTLLNGSGRSRATTEASTLAQQAIEAAQTTASASLPADGTVTVECVDPLGNVSDAGVTLTTAANAQCAQPSAVWGTCSTKYERDTTWSTVAGQTTRTLLVQVCWQDQFGGARRITQ